MILPNVDAAQIPENKILGYLLSSTHRSGKAKAAFFVGAGFRPQQWEKLAAALNRHARENPVVTEEATVFGRRYVVDGPLIAADGTALNVRSVWFINNNETAPRFVTAHPLKRKIA